MPPSGRRRAACGRDAVEAFVVCMLFVLFMFVFRETQDEATRLSRIKCLRRLMEGIEPTPAHNQPRRDICLFRQDPLAAQGAHPPHG